MILKLIVAGSRTITDKVTVFTIIDKHINWLLSNHHLFNLKDLVIVSGTANGPDSIAIEYAEEKNIKLEKFPAQWINEKGILDKSAGFKRNEKMALNSTHLLAIWDGKSRGTSHMIQLMEAKDKHVHVFVYEPKDLE